MPRAASKRDISKLKREPREAGKRLRAAPLMVLLIGLVLGAVALNGAWNNYVLLRGDQRADGVVALEMGGGARSLVRFATSNGSMITYTQNKFIFARYKGDKVTVLYNQFVPTTSAQADDPLALWFNPVLFAALGAGLVYFSVRFFRASAQGKV